MELASDAFEDGEAKDRSEGKAEGLVEGEAKGDAKAREQVAINMLAEGIDPGVVARLSGLSADRVAELDRARLDVRESGGSIAR